MIFRLFFSGVISAGASPGAPAGIESSQPQVGYGGPQALRPLSDSLHALPYSSNGVHHRHPSEVMSLPGLTPLTGYIIVTPPR